MANPVPVNLNYTVVSSASVTGSSQQSLVALTANNVYAMYQNTGASDVWINFSQNTAAVGLGFLLKANGGTLEFSSFIPTGGVNVYPVGNTTIAYIYG